MLISSMHVSSFLEKELNHLFTALGDRKSKRSVPQLKGEIISLRRTQEVKQVLGRGALPKVQAYLILSIDMGIVLK